MKVILCIIKYIKKKILFFKTIHKIFIIVIRISIKSYNAEKSKDILVLKPLEYHIKESLANRKIK